MVGFPIEFSRLILLAREERAREDVQRQHADGDQEHAGPGELLPVVDTGSSANW